MSNMEFEVPTCYFCGNTIAESDMMKNKDGDCLCHACAKFVTDAFENPEVKEYKNQLEQMYGEPQNLLLGTEQAKTGFVIPESNEEPAVTAEPLIRELPTPSQIKAHLDQYVIGQEHTKITLSVAVYNHYKRLMNPNPDVEIEKSNILLVGPTGSGKTYIAKSLARFLGVPFAIADATTLTEAGYVGDDVENILTTLLQNADGNIDACEQGIIYIDEIDKIGRKGENTSITRDVSGEGVQQALLKIIEGTKAGIQPNAQRKHPNGERIIIDTSNILFICGGAFEGIEKILENGTHKIGFNAKEENTKTERKITHHALMKFGMMPELMGRLPIISVLDALTEDDLCKILTEPKNAITKQYEALIDMDGVKLDFTKPALKIIARHAVKQKTGARGLRSIIERTMEPIMFELPDKPDTKTVTVTPEMIEKQIA